MHKLQALPFILVDQTTSEVSLKIHPKSFQIFHSDSIKNKKIAILTVAGYEGTGKSFLSNQLLNKMKALTISQTTKPCTKGIWILGEPIKINDDTVLIIMNTKGLKAGCMKNFYKEKEMDTNSQIFCLSILLSSVLLYNCVGKVDDKMLEDLFVNLKKKENIVVSENHNSDEQISQYFPNLYWLLRDFPFNSTQMSENDYLQSHLQPINPDQEDFQNKIRSKIRKLFPRRQCQCFPVPVNENLVHILQASDDDLTHEFKQKIELFTKKLYENMPVKEIKGKAITGQIYLNLVHEYVNGINKGELKIITSFENVIASEARKACQTYFSIYKTAMEKYMSQEKLPLDEKQIQKNYNHFKNSLSKKFEDKFKLYQDTQNFQSAKAKLDDCLYSDYKQRLQQNSKISEIKCEKHLLQIFQQVQLPVLTSSEEITASLLPEKMSSLNKKLKEYFQEEKGVKKYHVFVEKYPKYILNYFSKLTDRIKRVYNEELSELKKEKRQFCKQIDSVKRVSKQQDSLNMKQRRELESLTMERDGYEKKAKMQEELIKCYEQAQNQRNNDLRKAVREHKQEILQLQQQNNDLVENLEKLKTKLEAKRQVSNGAESHFQLPSHLVQTLHNLQNKLATMNEFYENEVEDGFNNQLVEKQMEEKYTAMEKVRQQYQLKIDELKRKNAKTKENYEKKYETLERYCEKIRNQNIELEKRDSEGSGGEKTIRGLLNERKKFQESLRQKKITLNSQKMLNENQKIKIVSLEEGIMNLQEEIAILSIENANFRSFKESFSFVLRESLCWALNRKNKLQHSMKSLDEEDKVLITKTFQEVGLKSP